MTTDEAKLKVIIKMHDFKEISTVTSKVYRVKKVIVKTVNADGSTSKVCFMSLRMRKLTIWVSDQVRHTPACTVKEAG